MFIRCLYQASVDVKTQMPLDLPAPTICARVSKYEITKLAPNTPSQRLNRICPETHPNHQYDITPVLPHPDMPFSNAKRTASVLSPQPSQLRHQRQATQTALPPSLDPLYLARDPSDAAGGNLPPQKACRMRNVPRRRVQRPNGAHVQAVAVPGL